MVARKLSWFERLLAHIRPESHGRVCRNCHKPIKKHHRWHYVQAGWFAPVKCYEHRNCKNPTLESPYELAQKLGPELPLEYGIPAEIADLAPTTWPTYGGIKRDSLNEPEI